MRQHPSGRDTPVGEATSDSSAAGKSPHMYAYVQSVAGSSAVKATAEDVSNKVDAFNSMATVAALIFGFSVSTLYDSLKDDVAGKWCMASQCTYVAFGLLAVTGSFLPTLVIPFRIYYLRQLLGNGGAQGIARASNFQASTMYMAVPCMGGLLTSAVALVGQISIMLFETQGLTIFVLSMVIAVPVTVMAFFFVLRMIFHDAPVEVALDRLDRVREP